MQESVAINTLQSLSSIGSSSFDTKSRKRSLSKGKTIRFFNVKLAFFIGVAILTTSCASPQKSTTPTNKNEVKTAVTETLPNKTSATDYLEMARSADSASIDNFVAASNAYLLEQSFIKAIALSQETLALIKALNIESGISVGYAKERYRLEVILANAFLNLEDFEQSEAFLKKADAIAKKNKIAHQLSYYQALKNTSFALSKPIVSIDAQLRGNALQSTDTSSLENRQSDAEQLWQQITQLSSWEIEQLEKLAAPNAKGWVALAENAHRLGNDKVAFVQYIKRWQKRFPSHPADFVAQQLTSTSVEENNVENIAVLLPLSGRQMKAGNAAAQGILAAYSNDDSKTLHFIDTQTLDFSTLNEQFIAQDIDIVVGPLLKSKVTEYLAQDNLTLPTILLNTASQELLPYQVSFSMKPEDEAIQAASILSEKQFKSPLILSHKDSVSDRITNSFVAQWKKLTGDTPEIIRFERGQTMQREVTTSLGVTDSKTRIKDLESRLKQTIKTESRNRRDIDMIYIVGSPTQTRLVKPYIDVNISPFADLVPIYASSRSHSINIDASEKRDLEGLVFTEMPWLLSSKQQNRQLMEQSMTLWPKRSDSLQRIFAMGFDSYSILDKLPAMKSSPYIRHYGQTGVLQLDDSNLITRSLLWGRYRKDRVEEIAMD